MRRAANDREVLTQEDLVALDDLDEVALVARQVGVVLRVEGRNGITAMQRRNPTT